VGPQRDRVLIVIAWLSLILIGLLDYLDSSPMALSAVYVLPIVVLSAAGGRRLGVLGAEAAAAIQIGVLIADSGFDGMLPWQALLLPFVYAGIALAVSRLAEQRMAESRLLRELEAEHARVEELSRRDVTGLYNSRHLYEWLAATLEESRAHRYPVSVITLDVDNLKQVNDTLGHRMGDLLIQSVAEGIVEETRDAYPAARLGGDEFAVLVQNSTVEEAAALARRILSNLADRRVPGTDVAPSVSIGVASTSDGADDPDALLHRSDLAMYAGKRLGGGRVTVG
jgi:diguanylate cyclase (GGDEF)-like protein